MFLTLKEIQHEWPDDGNAFVNKNIAHHAESLHGDREIVSISADGAKHRYTFKDSMIRARKVSSILNRIGISKFTG